MASAPSPAWGSQAPGSRGRTLRPRKHSTGFSLMNSSQVPGAGEGPSPTHPSSSPQGGLGGDPCPALPHWGPGGWRAGQRPWPARSWLQICGPEILGEAPLPSGVRTAAGWVLGFLFAVPLSALVNQDQCWWTLLGSWSWSKQPGLPWAWLGGAGELALAQAHRT